MRLFFAAPGGFPDPVDPTRRVSSSEMTHVHLPEGLPFVLRDDGSVDEPLQEFFRELPKSLGMRSPHSWRACGRDLMSFIAFLASRPEQRTIWSAQTEDLDDYHYARRFGPLNVRLTPKSWDRAVSMIECFFRWAVAHGRVAALPFAYEQRRRWRLEEDVVNYSGRHDPSNIIARNDSERRNAAREAVNPEPEIRHISIRTFRLYRDVGLRHSTTTAQRNSALANLLLLTGMRIQEGASLLDQDIPGDDELRPLADGESYTHRLAPACAKGQKARKTYWPVRVALELREYAAVERVDAIARGLASGAYDRPGWFRVQYNKSQRRFEGEDDAGRAWRGSIDVLSPTARSRLLIVGGDGTPEPAALFLAARTGLPVRIKYWDRAFRDGSAFCQRQGYAVKVTPHDLRHTYAIHMLSDMIRKSAEYAAALAHGRPGDRVYQVMFSDALQLLRTLLGHASVTTTYAYLRCLKESQTIVNDAAVALADRVMAGSYIDDIEEPGA